MVSDDEEELADDQEVEIDPKRLARIEKEKRELLASLAGGDFSTQRTKVAAILNLYPESRNSDITLALKYWETFQPDIYNKHGILPKDLFKLERLHYIVRARAKIQNEYGLFQADAKVKHCRKKNEEVIRRCARRRRAEKSIKHLRRRNRKDARLRNCCCGMGPYRSSRFHRNPSNHSMEKVVFLGTKPKSPPNALSINHIAAGTGTGAFTMLPPKMLVLVNALPIPWAEKVRPKPPA